VVILVIVMTFHHVICDRDPYKVPTFVKRSVQFDSDTESSEDEGALGDEEEGNLRNYFN